MHSYDFRVCSEMQEAKYFWAAEHHHYRTASETDQV